jgi:hypothetical protein
MPRCPDCRNANGRRHEIPPSAEMVGVLLDVVSRPLLATVDVEAVEP